MIRVAAPCRVAAAPCPVPRAHRPTLLEGSDDSGPLQREQQLLAARRLIVPQRALAGSRRDRLQPARLAERIEHGLRELLGVELGEIHLSRETSSIGIRRRRHHSPSSRSERLGRSS